MAAIRADELQKRRLSEALKEVRKRDGISQETAARRINVSLNQYREYEHGTNEPRMSIFLRICETFGLDANALTIGSQASFHERRAIAHGDRRRHLKPVA